MRFKDRADAGQQLAQVLADYRYDDVIVYALPRGGVILGYYISKFLNAPLDLIITRKIGHPYNPEYAVCAVAEDGHAICNDDEANRINPNWLEEQMQIEQREAMRRRKVYAEKRRTPDISGKTAIIVDDGVATGLTFILAIRELRHRNPKQIVAALPVVPEDIAEAIRREVDDLVVLNVPFEYLGAVGAYYDEFYPVSDDEVVSLLEQVR